jgi:hypothetical protein
MPLQLQGNPGWVGWQAFSVGGTALGGTGVDGGLTIQPCTVNPADLATEHNVRM